MIRNIILAITLILTITTCYGQNNDNVTWKYSAKNLNNGNVELLFNAKIADGYHLYSPFNPAGASMPLSIKLEESKDFSQVGEIQELQKAISHYEEVFDVTEKYFIKKADFKIVIKPSVTTPFEVKGKISGQVCNDESACSMVRNNFSINVTPQKPEDKPKSEVKSEKQEVKTEEPKANETTQTEVVKTADTIVATQNEISVSTSDTITVNPPATANNNYDSITNSSLWEIFFIAFLAGLAAIFTPCVFPMIPMTVTFFLKDKSGHGKVNALIYGLSIILLYTLPVAILILIAHLIGGENFTAGIFNALSTHWLPNIIFFVIFFVFALSFLGMFEITMPSSLINKAEKRGDKGGLIGVFFLAFVLVLVSFSCTGPIVGSVLVESASGNDFLKPIIAMLGFSLAFAMPFTLFAYFPEIMKKLPKSGSWLNTVKVILGFLELALGLKFLSVADQTYHWHLLDRETYLAIWIAIGIMLTMYLLGKLKLPNDSETSNIKVPRLILAILTLSFVVYLIPGMFGAPLKALAGYIPPITTQDFVLGKNVTTVTESKSTLCNTPKYSDKLHLPYGIEAYFDYNEALQCAKNQNKPLLLIFTGHGCVNCRKMEENVWSDEGVQNMMKNNFVICALYTDDRTMSEDGVKTIGEVNTELEIANYQMSAQPYYVIENPNQPGKAVKEPMKYNPDIENFKQFLDIKK